LRHVLGKEDAQISALTIPMKINKILKDPFGFMLQVMGAYFFMMMYIPMLFRTTYRILNEKEIKARELMRMMGMSDTPYWLSWYFYHTCINTMLSLIVWPILIGVFENSSYTILLVFSWLYGQSLFGYMIIWQSITSKARMGAVAAVVFYFASSVTFVLAPSAPRSQKIIEALMPTTAMSHTVKCIVGFE
jgi:ATP-binding cassette subfamily A (ABC1) protein 3